MSFLTLLRAPAAAVAAVLFLPEPLPAETDFASFYPDTAVVFIEAPDLARLRKLAEHPVVKPFTSDEVIQALAAALSGNANPDTALSKFEEVLKDETGLPLQSLMDRFPGGVSGAVLEWHPSFTERSQTISKFAIVADYLGDEELIEQIIAALERLDDKETPLQDEYEVSEYEHENVVMHVLKEKESDQEKFGERSCYAWAVTEEKLLVASGETALRDIIDRVLKKSVTRLSESEDFRRLAEEAAPADFRIIAPVRRWFKGLFDLMDSLGGDAGPFSPRKMLKALELEQIQGAAVRLNFTEDHAELDLTATYDAKPEVFKFIATDGPGEPPHFIPPDVTRSRYGTLVFSQIWRRVRRFMEEHIPMMQLVIEERLGEIEQHSGVDLEEDILGRLGKKFFTAGTIGPPAEEDHPSVGLFMMRNFPITGPDDSFVFGVEATYAESLAGAVKSLCEGFDSDLLSDRECHGFTIHKVTSTPPGIGIAWAVADGWLLLNAGKPDVLEKILERMDKGKDASTAADGLWSREEIKGPIDALPSEDQIAAQFYDLGADLAMVARTLPQELDVMQPLMAALFKADFRGAVYHKTTLGEKRFRHLNRIVPKR